ncbi:hypothetical protein TruAng_011303 [Truncatella angustata]|nr:hypothetical protein TruAng_011303 [Truncatella angustata]
MSSSANHRVKALARRNARRSGPLGPLRMVGQRERHAGHFNPFAIYRWDAPRRAVESNPDLEAGRRAGEADSPLEIDWTDLPPLQQASSAPAELETRASHGGTGDRRRISFNDRSHSAAVLNNLTVRNRKPASIERGSAIESFLYKRPTRFTVTNQVLRTFFSSWVNVLLPCVPAGIILHAKLGDSVATFIINFIAIFPLSFMCEMALDEISLRVGDLIMGLLYARETVLLQTSLVGSLLANLLLILGLSIYAGSHQREHQYFNLGVAHTSANLLSLAATSLLIPTASKLLDQMAPDKIPKQSRGASFILIWVYACYMYYQFRSHTATFREETQKSEKWAQRTRERGIAAAIQTGTVIATAPIAHAMLRDEDIVRHTVGESEDDTSTTRTPNLHLGVAVATFIISAGLSALCVDYTVNSINALSTGAKLSQTFIGLVLLPIPNCDLAPISHAIEDRLDNAMNFTIGKCLQTALFITPLVVLIAWGMGVDGMTLVFDGFEVVSLFAAILLLNFLLIEGKDSRHAIA